MIPSAVLIAPITGSSLRSWLPFAVRGCRGKGAGVSMVLAMLVSIALVFLVVQSKDARGPLFFRQGPGMNPNPADETQSNSE